MKKKKLTGDIEKDFPVIMLGVIASSAIDSAVFEVAQHNKNTAEFIYSKREEFILYLISSANEHYAANIKRNKYVGSMISGAKSATAIRDFHHTFMRHWLAAKLYTDKIVQMNMVTKLAQGL
jgi:hypothetical protein